MKTSNISNCCDGRNCSKCGGCCTIGIPITRKEEKVIREYIKENNIEKEELIDKENNNFYADCCFHDRKTKLCKIYPVRPNICKSFKCCRKQSELEKEKIENHERAYWNHMDEKGNTKHFTTFDLLFYNDPIPLLTLLFNSIKGDNDEKKYEYIMNFLEDQGHTDLVKSMTPVYDNEEK